MSTHTNNQENPTLPAPPPRKQGKRGDKYTTYLRKTAIFTLKEIGWTRRDIARVLQLDPKTVRTHLKNDRTEYEAGTGDADLSEQLAELRSRVVAELRRRLEVIEDQDAEDLSGVSTLSSLSTLLDRLERSTVPAEPEADTRPIAQRPSVFDRYTKGKGGDLPNV